MTMVLMKMVALLYAELNYDVQNMFILQVQLFVSHLLPLVVF